MIEIRIHGRGGQGAVIASLILARAAFHKGLHVQAFPQFGVERRGAPVLAFARVSPDPIQLRTNVYRPHDTMVLDPSLIEHVDITAGLRPEGWIIINASQPPQDFPLYKTWHVASVDANSIAAKYRIGTPTQPIVNTTMVGALVRVTGIVGLEELTRAIAETIPSRTEANQNASREAYEGVVMSTPSSTGVAKGAANG